MKRTFALPYRQIHLDFHTGPWIPDVGRDFDARDFARTMKRAHVNSVTTFAKCHHGHLYYNTRRPERHPGLKPGLDLLREQVEALHRVGIRAPIYISVQCDEYAADTHPEWIARKADGAPVGAGPLSPGWQILDMSSPYQEFLADQTREVLRLFRPVDGIFFDMCWDQPSLNNYTVEALQREGLDPEDEEQRKKFARLVAHRYMKRFFNIVKASSREATVYFNSRPLHNLAEEIQYHSQVEIEALPTGGWGYMYFPKNVRFARTLGRPYLGMTARFHKSWADFGGLKPYAALEYETSQMMAHGARCSIGDQLHPRGVLDKAAYELIGNVYRRVEERQPWLEGATVVSQIGLFQVPTTSTRVLEAGGGSDEGATRMLTQLKHQFDVVIPESDLARYELLVLPDCVPVDGALARRLREYLRGGGALLVTGASGLNADGTAASMPELGIRPTGISPYKTTYVRFGPEIAAGVPPTDHVMYEKGVRVTPAASRSPTRSGFGVWRSDAQTA
ncbi:MAG: alpha-L-fucosidase [Planctomycetota bacterium]|nr:alpha-L-fucosidase [Planctomycetota bacterium]